MAETKRPGRPPLDANAPSADVHLTLRVADYERLDQLATKRRESVQDIIRRSLKRLLSDERG